MTDEDRRPLEERPGAIDSRRSMRLALGGAAGLALGLAGWGCGRTMLLLEPVDAGSTDGGPIVAVTTVAGNGRAGHADGIGGPSGVATFDGPCGLASDVAGNLYVADSRNHDIRKIDLRGNVTTLAGNGMDETADGTGGPNGTASFVNPYGLSIDHSGQLYVADAAASLIRRIDLFQNVVTFAGQTGQG